MKTRHCGSPGYDVILLEGEDTVVHHHEYLDTSHLTPGTERYTQTV